MIIDFLLDICARIFAALKKKSKSTYWQSMEIANVQTIKKRIIEKILTEKAIKEKLTEEEIDSIRKTIYKNEGLVL